MENLLTNTGKEIDDFFAEMKAANPWKDENFSLMARANVIRFDEAHGTAIAQRLADLAGVKIDYFPKVVPTAKPIRPLAPPNEQRPEVDVVQLLQKKVNPWLNESLNLTQQAALFRYDEANGTTHCDHLKAAAEKKNQETPAAKATDARTYQYQQQREAAIERFKRFGGNPAFLG